ncbi:MAG: CHC2 zinc finger domain-containing protein [Bacteroidota bacterium]|nr:CHC2 zinc finger domain-containing protein [Bacteroidota bacterium]
MQISEIKQQLLIKTVLNHYEIHPDKHNMSNCPLHADKTSSMKIYPETNTCTCFLSNCEADSDDALQSIQK